MNTIAVNVLLIAGAAVAWNIFSGYTGYISLGHATYVGLGAYSLAIVCQDWHIPGGWGPFLLLPLVGLIVGAFALPVGWIALHAARYTFLIITIAIFFIFQLLAYNLQSVTGGSSGIYLPNPDWSDLSFPFYFVACVFLLIGMFISWRIRHSKFGLGLLAIRDDEDRARGLGIRTGRYKLGAYVISAILIGVEGAISIYFLGFTNPSVAFDKSFDLTIVAASFLGGIGTVLGPLVGGLLFAPVQTLLIQQFGAMATGLDQILFGSFLLVIILLLPDGIVPALGKLWKEGRTSLFKKQVQIGIMEIYSSSALLLPASLPAHALTTIDLEVKSTDNQSILTEQETHRNAWVSPPLTKQLIMPHRPSIVLHAEQPIVPHWPSTVLHNAKDRRLVAYTGRELMPSPEKMSPTPKVSWRCPGCGKPFTLKEGICYCPRCGIIRQVIEGNS
jgi:branched-chain amino acid transport system permease protein